MKKVSDITYQDIANYIRVDVTDDKLLQEELNIYLNIAKDFISNYTGIPIETKEKDSESLDDYADFILCQDMYDNRTMYVDGKNVNRVVETILNMHRRNLL